MYMDIRQGALSCDRVDTEQVLSSTSLTQLMLVSHFLINLTLCSPFPVTWSHTCGREDKRLSLCFNTRLLVGMSKEEGNYTK